MRNLILTLALLTAASGFAQRPAVISGDYTVDIHVRASSLYTHCVGEGCGPWQHLTALIGEHTYELESYDKYLLRTGDYKARIVEDQKPDDHDYLRVYEFLFSNGKTRRYTVVGETE